MTTASTDTNYPRVTEGLRTLTAVLAPYVAQELRAALGGEWWSRGVLGVLHENQRRDLPAAGPDGELIAKLVSGSSTSAAEAAEAGNVVSVVRAERRLDGPAGLPSLRRRGRGKGTSSKVDSFWRTVVAREDFRSALRTAADGSDRGRMSHAKSLGRMAIASGVLAAWPSTEFCFTIDRAGQWLTVRSDTP